MALYYYLTIENINDELSPDHIRELLISVFFLEYYPDSGILMSDGAAVTVFREDDEESVFKNPYPDICVAFRIDKFRQYDKGLDMMVKAVSRLASYLDGDMSLSPDEEEEVLFQRISGELMFGDDPEFWSDARLSLFEMNAFEAVP